MFLNWLHRLLKDHKSQNGNALPLWFSFFAAVACGLFSVSTQLCIMMALSTSAVSSPRWPSQRRIRIVMVSSRTTGTTVENGQDSREDHNTNNPIVQQQQAVPRHSRPGQCSPRLLVEEHQLRAFLRSGNWLCSIGNLGNILDTIFTQKSICIWPGDGDRLRRTGRTQQHYIEFHSIPGKAENAEPLKMFAI